MVLPSATGSCQENPSSAPFRGNRDQLPFIEIRRSEGEVGFGKPDLRVYQQALDMVGVDPTDAWMVGDNLAWDVAKSQQLGIFSVWIDREGKGRRNLQSVTPDRIIRTLSDLRSPF